MVSLMEMNSSSPKILLSVLLATLLVVGVIVLLVVDSFTRIPNFTEVKDKVRMPIHNAKGEKIFRWVGPNTAEWAPMSQISNHLLMAVIASEDSAFYQHDGLDYHEIREAIKKDFREKKWARGASTLTQQVVKNLYLTTQKTLWRKIKEMVWARELEKALSKSEILCLYVNLAEWGPGIYGVKQAARYYFSNAPADLTPTQSAFLAMLLPSPLKYSASFKKKELTSWAEKRTKQILSTMNRLKLLEDAEYEAALSESLWKRVKTTASDGGTEESPPGGEAVPAEEIPEQGEIE